MSRDLNHLVRSFMVIGLALLLFACIGALTGCGGGDLADDALADERVQLDPPDCATRPEICR